MSARTAQLLLTIASAAAAASGCGTNGDALTSPTVVTTTTITTTITTTTTPTTTPTTTTTTTAPSSTPPASEAMSWTSPFEIDLGNGWAARDCEGDRTNVCVFDGSTLLGDVELLTGYPLEEGDEDEDPQVVAEQWALGMIEHFREDRATGCPDFTFTGDAVRPTSVGGRPGARGGFTLSDASGRVVERVINYYVIVDERAAIVNIDAYVAEGGCLGPSEYDPSFTPDRLAVLEPLLDALIAATPVQPV